MASARGQVRTLIVMGFLFSGGLTAVSPVLGEVITTFSVTPAAAGLLLTMFAVGRLSFSVAGGAIADRVTLLPVVLIACVIVLSASLLAVFTTSFELLVAARGIQGVGTAIYMVAGTGHIIDVSPSDRLPSLLAWNQSMFLAGMAVAPALGGLSASIWDYRGPFALPGVYSLAGIVTAMIFLRGTTRPRDRAGATSFGAREVERSQGLRDLICTPVFLAVLGVSLLVGSIRSGIRSGVIPLYAEDLFDYGPAEIGLLMTVSGVANLVVMFPVAKSIEALGWRRVMLVSTPLCALPLFSAAFVQQPWHLYAALTLLVMLSGFSGVVSANAVAELAAPRVRRTAIGVDRTVRDAAFAASPIVAIQVASVFGHSTLFVGTGLLAIALGVAIHVTLTQHRGT